MRLPVLGFLLLATPAFAQTEPDGGTTPPAPPGTAPAAPQGFVPNEQGLAIKVSPLGDGIVRSDQWTSVRVQLLNAGDDATGTIRVAETSADGTTSLSYSRRIELPKGTRKDVQLALRPGFAYGQRHLEFVADDGRGIDQPYKLRTADPADATIAVLGDDAFGIKSIADAWTGPIPGRTVRAGAAGRKVQTGLVPLAAMPEKSVAYASFDWVVWPQADPGDITAEQMTALQHYVADGGHLWVSVAGNSQKVVGTPLDEMLPVALHGAADVPNIKALFDVIGAYPTVNPPTVPIALATLKTADDRHIYTWAADAEGHVLWASGSYGLGTVSVLCADPTVEPITKIDKVEFWRRMLWLPAPDVGDGVDWLAQADGARHGYSGSYSFVTTDWTTGQGSTVFSATDVWPASETPPIPADWAAALDLATSSAMAGIAPEAAPMYGGSYGYGPTWDFFNEVRTRLRDITGVEPLPLSWLLLFSAAYLLVIGPIDWFVLRLIKRQPLTWITFPIYIIVFSGIALFTTSVRKGSQAAVVRIELVDQLPGTRLWRGDTYMGVFATRKSDVEIRSGFEDGVAITLPQDSGSMWDPYVRSDEGPGLVGWRAETWSFAYARTAWTHDAAGTVRVYREGGALLAKNELPFSLKGASLHVNGNMYEIGPMAPGEIKPIPSSATPFQPSGAYGVAIDLRTAEPPAIQEWARGRFLSRIPGDRALYDALGAHPTVLAVADQPVEPFNLSGFEPQTRQVTVLRIPVADSVVAGLGGTVPSGSYYGGYGYGGYVAPPSGPTYNPGTKVKIREVAPDDSNASLASTLVGQECVIDSYTAPTDQKYFYSNMICGGQTYYFYKVTFDVIEIARNVPSTAVVKIVDVPYDDTNYSSRSMLIGKECTAIGDLTPMDAKSFTGTLRCGSTDYYFYKVQISVVSAPEVFATGEKVTIVDVGPDDGQSSTKASYIGQACTISSDLTPTGIDDWYMGTIDCTLNGSTTSTWFYEVKVEREKKEETP